MYGVSVLALIRDNCKLTNLNNIPKTPALKTTSPTPRLPFLPQNPAHIHQIGYP